MVIVSYSCLILTTWYMLGFLRQNHYCGTEKQKQRLVMKLTNLSRAPLAMSLRCSSSVLPCTTSFHLTWRCWRNSKLAASWQYKSKEDREFRKKNDTRWMKTRSLQLMLLEIGNISEGEKWLPLAASWLHSLGSCLGARSLNEYRWPPDKKRSYGVRCSQVIAASPGVLSLFFNLGNVKNQLVFWLGLWVLEINLVVKFTPNWVGINLVFKIQDIYRHCFL